jgi:hypothetical protein
MPCLWHFRAMRAAPAGCRWHITALLPCLLSPRCYKHIRLSACSLICAKTDFNLLVAGANGICWTRDMAPVDDITNTLMLANTRTLPVPVLAVTMVATCSVRRINSYCISSAPNSCRGMACSAGAAVWQQRLYPNIAYGVMPAIGWIASHRWCWRIFCILVERGVCWHKHEGRRCISLDKRRVAARVERRTGGGACRGSISVLYLGSAMMARLVREQAAGRRGGAAACRRFLQFLSPHHRLLINLCCSLRHGTRGSGVAALLAWHGRRAWRWRRAGAFATLLIPATRWFVC